MDGEMQGINWISLKQRSVFFVWLLGLALLGSACQQVSAPAQQPAAAPNAAMSAPTQVTPANASVTTHRRPEIGFTSRQKYLDHFAKHGREFGDISAEEYLRQAQTLRDRPAGKDVLEVVRADGVITRFDNVNGAFLAFNADLTIRTFFKPNDGVNYFWRQSRRQGD
jgi:pyocin large subunit-like protein